MGSSHQQGYAEMGGVEPRLSVWCIEEKGPAKKEGGWIAPPSRFRLKDHETLLVYAGLVLGLSTQIDDLLKE